MSTPLDAYVAEARMVARSELAEENARRWSEEAAVRSSRPLRSIDSSALRLI
jgi:hypothetical protein